MLVVFCTEGKGVEEKRREEVWATESHFSHDWRGDGVRRGRGETKGGGGLLNDVAGKREMAGEERRDGIEGLET